MRNEEALYGRLNGCMDRSSQTAMPAVPGEEKQGTPLLTEKDPLKTPLSLDETKIRTDRLRAEIRLWNRRNCLADMITALEQGRDD